MKLLFLQEKGSDLIMHKLTKAAFPALFHSSLLDKTAFASLAEGRALGAEIQTQRHQIPPPNSSIPLFPRLRQHLQRSFFLPHLPVCCHLQDLLDFGQDLLCTAPLLLHGVAVAEPLRVQPGQLPLGQGQPHAPLLPAKGHREHHLHPVALRVSSHGGFWGV